MSDLHIDYYRKLLTKLNSNSEKFWSKVAEELEWDNKWSKTIESTYPKTDWFVNGKTNIVTNAIDRHLKIHPEKKALIWVGENGIERTFTYKQLNDEVSKHANILKKLEIKKGDRVIIYLPRIPELLFSMLACAKIGAIHSVVYSGFSSQALAARIENLEPKLLITTDGYSYKGKTIETTSLITEAIKNFPKVKTLIIENLLNQPKSPKYSYLTDFKDISTSCDTEIVDANDPLFILYTSGTTGKPKGIVHSHGGYMVGIYLTLKTLFDIQPDDIYWCTADPGWITGHSYVSYAPFINGITSFVYEGAPEFPDPGIWWRLIEKYKITKFYTTPTAIRALKRHDDSIPIQYDLSSLKILGTVGEPINPAAWKWFHSVIGKGRCPIIDTWWQTETGMHIIAPTPDIKLKPGFAQKPFLTIDVDIVDDNGYQAEPNTHGYLVIKNPWPAMFKAVLNDEETYKKLYFEKINNNGHSKNSFTYFTGDTALKDNDGDFWIVGRNDDVLKISGYRLGTAEIESAITSYEKVVESAVIGIPDEIKGESIKTFVVLHDGITASGEVETEIKKHVRDNLGPIAVPSQIEFVDSLPKTRSGKIMRRLLKAKELHQDIGDTSTLEN